MFHRMDFWIVIGIGLLASLEFSVEEGRAEEGRGEEKITSVRADFTSPELLSKIAFGSCSKQDLPQPIWQAVIQTEPDLFLYLGDNIYGDSLDPTVLKAKWDQQKQVPGYAALREKCRVLGTWDDHDYGVNDAGAELPIKRESQQLFLDFLDEPADSLRRKREGVYASYVFGPVGKRVQILLLDTRYFRTALTRNTTNTPGAEGIAGPYRADDNPESDMLGPQQWTWLEEQLTVPAELRLLVSSIQVIPEEHGFEKWANHNHQRQQLLSLLEQTEAAGVIILSGDRHAAEFSRLSRESTYDLWEVTSSSLNRPRGFQNELNKHRVGLMYSDTNFGLMTINWNQIDPEITLQILSETGRPVLQMRTGSQNLK